MGGGVGKNNLFDTQRYKGKVYISHLFDVSDVESFSTENKVILVPKIFARLYYTDNLKPCTSSFAVMLTLFNLLILETTYS